MRTIPYQPSVLTWSLLIVTSATFISLSGCNATVRTATREAKPLAYVGQVQFGEPTDDAGQVVVPLKYVGGDWMRNSAIVPIDLDTTVSDSEVEITVITSVATDGDVEKGYKLILPEDSKGEYTIYYRDPDGARHKIGIVKIEE